MRTAKKFDLNRYIREVCKEAGVDPGSNLIKEDSVADIALRFSITYEELLKIVVIQNWNPFIYSKSEKKDIDAVKIIDLLKDFNVESGLVPKEDLLNYILYAKEYIGGFYLITDTTFAEGLFNFVQRVIHDPRPIIIYGERGTNRKWLAFLISMKTESNMPIEERAECIKPAVDCGTLQNELLYARIFGHVKGSHSTAYEDKLGLIGEAINGAKEELYNGFLVLEEFQKAGNQTQKAIFHYFNNHTFYRLGDNVGRASLVNIICTVDASSKDKIESVKRQYCLEYPGAYFGDEVYLYPLRYGRWDIPLSIYMFTKKIMAKYNYNGLIGFPFILLQYWLKEEQWPGNYSQLEDEVKDYVYQYIMRAKTEPWKFIKSKNNFYNSPKDKKSAKRNTQKSKVILGENKKTFLELIEFPFNSGFKSYIKNRNHEPYDIITLNGFVYKPYLYYALRHFNRKKKEWGFDPKLIRIFLSNMATIDLSEPKDLFAKTGERDIESKDLERPTESIEVEKINIKKIVIEIKEKCEGYPKIMVFPTDESEPWELQHNKGQRARISLLTFLIYERSNIDKRGRPKIPDWGINWLDLMSPEFKPFRDLCRWYGYDPDDPDITLPGWFYAYYNLSSTISHLKKIFKNNKICGEIIKKYYRPPRKSTFHLNDKIEAEKKTIKNS